MDANETQSATQHANYERVLGGIVDEVKLSELAVRALVGELVLVLEPRAVRVVQRRQEAEVGILGQVRHDRVARHDLARVELPRAPSGATTAAAA